MPFLFGNGLSDPVESVFFAILVGERHGVRDQFDNPGLGDSVMKPAAENEVFFLGAVSMVQYNERWGFADNQG